MIPRYIRLKNFLSYGDCELHLTGLKLVVLSGRNGEGKSALLDAMTWAVWGKGRGRNDDDRIRRSADHMAVEFHFESGGDVYRVLRKRTRGRAAALEFAQQTAAGWKSLNGSSIADTEKVIVRCVRMDFETFENSAFIAQGRADEFTKRTPRERKDVFRKILGLDVYEALSDAAIERRKEAEGLAKLVAAQCSDCEAQLQRAPQVREALAEVVAQLESGAARLRDADKAVAELAAVAHIHETIAKAANDAAQREETAVRAVTEEENALAAAVQAIADVEAAMAREAAAQDAHERLVQMRKEEAKLAAALAQVRTLEQDAARAQGEIDSERARLETKRDQAKHEVAVAQAAAASLGALEAEERTLAVRGDDLAKLREQAAAIAARETSLQADRAAAEGEAKRCRAENAEINTKQETLKRAGESGGAAECPLCRQPLSPGDLEHVVAEYSAQRKQLGERYKAAAAEVEVAERELAAAATERARLEAEAARGERELAVAREQLAARLGIARERAAALEAAGHSVAGVERSLERGEFAQVAREALATATDALGRLGYEGEAHGRLRAAIAELTPVEAELQTIAAARGRLDGLRQRRDEREARIVTLKETLVQSREAAAAARVDLESSEDATPRLREAEAEVAFLRSRLQQLFVEQGRLQREAEQIEESAARLEELRERAVAHAEEKGVYSDLAQAFGRDGVQAMLIEQSLPRLEQIANAMLGRMTGGRIMVALRTQRANKNGAIRETLDIDISDELGTRDYEMYSGGEAFRVDFALRIGLAKLLAERAGAELSTLIIDEGFGSQDAEGIDRLVEAITDISRDFRLILVVTHVEEMRARFEQRIEVTKDERGSIARVA